MSPDSGPRVLVVGAGISGAACAARLRAGGADVTVRERAADVGGRLAAPVLHGRPVDLGAAYFTVADDAFAEVVAGWQRRGLARLWTDTFDVAGGEPRSGPMRWAAPHGLAALARDLHGAVEFGAPVYEPDPAFDVTVLAMPDPAAAAIAGDDWADWVPYDPAIALAAGWTRRAWSLEHAAFVNDDPDLSLVVDDGSRHGDGAAVLVLHSTAALARAHPDAAPDAIGPLLAALGRRLGVDAQPEWTHVRAWPVAKPTGTHGDAPFARRGPVAACGDTWCPAGSPRLEAAWLSGHRLAEALLAS